VVTIEKNYFINGIGFRPCYFMEGMFTLDKHFFDKKIFIP